MFHNLKSSTLIIEIMKLSIVRWSEHVAFKGEIRNKYIILVGRLEVKNITQKF